MSSEEDGGAEQEARPAAAAEEEVEEAGPRDAVLVTDCTTRLGEAVVFALILQERRVRVLCKDASAATARFGCAPARTRGAELR